MKKMYETPEMEVFNFETTDIIMDGCNECTTNTGSCDVECPLDGDCGMDTVGCILDDPNCPSECFLDGICIPDINPSRV